MLYVRARSFNHQQLMVKLRVNNITRWNFNGVYASQQTKYDILFNKR
jgi:hypothetical protein